MDADFRKALADVGRAVDECTGLSLKGLTAPELRILIKRLGALEAKALAYQRKLINKLSTAPKEELGGELADVLADRLGISHDDAVRRIRDARSHGHAG